MRSHKDDSHGGKALAQPSRLWHNGSHSAAHLHFGTSSRKSTHEGLRIFKDILRYFPLLPNTCYSSDVLFTALEKLDFFPIPFPREGRDGITACDRVYADEGFHEAAFVNAWVEVHLQDVHD